MGWIKLAETVSCRWDMNRSELVYGLRCGRDSAATGKFQVAPSYKNGSEALGYQKGVSFLVWPHD